MKICPICDATYDEEVIRFCTKDGTPLIEDSEPSFVELPSEELEEPEEDDIGEITVIRRKDVPVPPPPIDEPAPAAVSSRMSERIVIPTDQPPPVQNVRPRPAQHVCYPPIEKPNTVKVVALTVFGTVVLLGLGAWLFWMLSPTTPVNGNLNVNTNLGAFNGNLNSNSAIDSNFNFNMNTTFPNINGNFNTNTNTNANVKTPTPTPKPSPSVTPTPSPGESPEPTPTRTPPVNANTRPTPSPTPRIGPRPTANPTRSPG